MQADTSKINDKMKISNKHYIKYFRKGTHYEPEIIDSIGIWIQLIIFCKGINSQKLFAYI